MDLDRLKRCITELIKRHETLRTTFVIEDGHLRRIVLDDPTPGWIWRDFSSEPADEREALALEFMDEERKEQIDITGGPQTRCMVARISETEHLMLFATHHLAADAASLVLLEEELSGLYAADAGAAGNGSTAESMPYTEFIEWQARTLAGPAESVAHWVTMIEEAERLDLDQVLGAATTATTPGYTMTVVPEGHAEREQVILGPELSQAVHDLVSASRCSLFMVLAAGLELVLHLRSGSRSFLVRTPTANRIRPEHRAVIGAMETQTFLKCDADPAQTFSALLAGVRQQVLAGLRYQGVPMSMILGSVLQQGEAASENVALGGSTVQFALFSHGRMANWPPSLNVIVCAGGRIGTPSDFQVFAMEEGKRLDGAAPGIVLEANNPGGAYTIDDVQDFLKAYRDVLKAVTANPGLTLAELSEIFPPLAVPAGSAADGAPAADGLGYPRPRGADDIEQRLLPLARSATGDETLTPQQSVIRAPGAAVETMVRLVEAINGRGDVAGVEVTLADLLEQPTMAGLAASLAERALTG